MRRAFTLIELMVTIAIILMISAIALPTIVMPIRHRQVNEAARQVSEAVNGARDAAIHNQSPCGIRLLPDPTINGIDYSTGLIDSSLPLAYNRFVMLQSAPDYKEGKVSSADWRTSVNTAAMPPYPCLMIKEMVVGDDSGIPLPNVSTSWYWNIRIGDKIQFNGAGPWYTIVGPMVTSNTELFVNIGNGKSPLQDKQFGINVNPEFLWLVNGRDDGTPPTTLNPGGTGQDGFIDSGQDGIDNDNDGLIDEATCTNFPLAGEWEIEQFIGSTVNGFQNASYVIQRRLVPSSREQSLPSNIVIDATGWANQIGERSKLPVNRLDGTVDIIVNQDGTIVPTTIYSTPSSFGMNSAFMHIWIAERSDVLAPIGTSFPTLPMPVGQWFLVSITSKTGKITNTENPPPTDPYSAAQQGQQ